MARRKSNKQVKAMLWRIKKKKSEERFAVIARMPTFTIKANQEEV